MNWKSISSSSASQHHKLVTVQVHQFEVVVSSRMPNRNQRPARVVISTSNLAELVDRGSGKRGSINQLPPTFGIFSRQVPDAEVAVTKLKGTKRLDTGWQTEVARAYSHPRPASLARVIMDGKTSNTPDTASRQSRKPQSSTDVYGRLAGRQAADKSGRMVGMNSKSSGHHVTVAETRVAQLNLLDSLKQATHIMSSASREQRR